MMAQFDHDALRDLVPLYAAGMLHGAEAATVESHLSTCRECLAEYRAYLPVAAALAQGVPQVNPPSSTRAAVLAVARRDRRSSGGTLVAWFAAAAMLVVSVGLGLTVRSLQNRVRALEARLSDALAVAHDAREQLVVATRTAREVQSPLSVLTAPDVRQINLRGQAPAPSASARAFWSRSRGILVTAVNLPALPPGRTYQLWFIVGRTPVSAGLLSTPDARGDLTTTIVPAVDLVTPDALAVSLEPAGGVAQPTGAIYLAGPAH